MGIEMSKPDAVLGLESREGERRGRLYLPMGFPHRHLGWVLPAMECSALGGIGKREISK